MTEKEKIKDLYVEKRLPIKTIIQELGVSKATFYRLLKKYNIKRVSLYKDKLKRLYLQNNLSSQQIADMFGVSKTTILREIRHQNLSKSKEAAEESRRLSCQEKYNSKNYFESDDFKKKRAATMKERYGVSHPHQSPEVRKKYKEAMQEQYGCSTPLENKTILSKKNQTMLKRYNCIIPLKSEKIRQKYNDSMLKKYREGLPIHPNKKTIRIIEGERLRAFAQKNNIGYSTLVRFIQQTEYRATEDDVKKFIESVHNNVSDIEQIIENELKLKKFNKKVLSYRPDFKLSDRLYLNVDGLYWHSEIHVENRYHFDMRKVFEENGLSILQFRADEVFDPFKKNIIKSISANRNMGIKERIYARKCKIKKLKGGIAKEFLIKNHMMGYKNSIAYGLEYNNRIVSVMTYKVIRGTLKVERFCSEANTSVVGGFSKLLKTIESQANFEKIDYWVDLRYGTGSFLSKLGFEHKKDTLGWQWTDFRETYNRLQCRANMDERKISQRKHAEELGWYKIYDAGQRLYRKEKA